MKLECKCHGVSGSCSMRTCWLAMSDFRRTGDYLRKKYNTAIEVTMNQDGTGFMVADKDFKGSTKNELVYVENSPDYCLMDRTAGERMNEELCFSHWEVGVCFKQRLKFCISALQTDEPKDLMTRGNMIKIKSYLLSILLSFQCLSSKDFLRFFFSL